MTRALIFGIGGQDGSYLADILTEKGYTVHGLYRRSSVNNLGRIQHLLSQGKIELHQGDLADPGSVERAILTSRPDEIYNLADQDDVRWSHRTPGYSADITAGAVGRLLQFLCDRFDDVKVFQPVSATMFGNASAPQDENTLIDPLSPYACAKAHAYHLARFYRREHNLWVSTGILYNHDSPRRGDGYLLQKICRAAVRMTGEQRACNEGRKLNLDRWQRVDVGYAREYMEAAWNILQLPQPDDFVLSSGRWLIIEDLVHQAFLYAKVPLEFAESCFQPIRENTPQNRSFLFGNFSRAEAAFGFSPVTTAEELVCGIIEHHLKASGK